MGCQVVMIHFMFLKGIESPRWVAMGIVVKLAQSVSSTHIYPLISFVADCQRDGS